MKEKQRKNQSTFIDEEGSISRRCHMCRHIHPIECFGKDKADWQGHSRRCCDCVRKITKQQKLKKGLNNDK